MGAESRITSKGQTTIPIEVRRALGIKTGDVVRYEIDGDKVRLIKKRNVMELAGILYDPNRRPLTIEEMDEAIMDAVAEDDERIKREWNEGRK